MSICGRITSVAQVNSGMSITQGNQMKNFRNLELVKDGVRIAFAIEDEIPDCVDMNGYEGMRGMASALSRTEVAGNIAELADLAETFRCSAVRVVRVGRDVAGRLISGGSYSCLDEMGVTVFQIADPKGDCSELVDSVEIQFLHLVAENAAGAFENWQWLTALLIAAREVDLPPVLPYQLMPNRLLIEKHDNLWWGLGVAASSQSAYKFATRLASCCSTWEDCPSFLSLASRWHRDNISRFITFEHLWSAFVCEKPLDNWNRAVVSPKK